MISVDNPEKRREIVQAVIDAGALALRFGRVERATLHEDGERAETDTDHTVMLGIIACAFAERFEPHLDIGKVAQFALVHDLVEAYAGDTPTFGISERNREEKEERERAAFERIDTEFRNTLPWIPETISKYESLATKEARYVKFLDKAMPKVTHVLNRAIYLKREGKSREDVSRFFDEQYSLLSKRYGAEHPQLSTLMRALMDEVLASGEFEK